MDTCKGQGAEPVAHIPCEEDHTGTHMDGLKDPAWLGRPHCAACGEILPTPTVVVVADVTEPITEAIGIVLRLAKRLDGLTVYEMNLMYGEGLAEVFADAQAWAVKN